MDVKPRSRTASPEPRASRTVSVDTATSRTFDNGAPLNKNGIPGALEQRAVATRDQLIVRRSVGTTQFQRSVTAGFARARNNLRPGSRCRFSRDRQVAELFVFPGNVHAFGLPMHARASDALGEVAPIRRLKRAFMRVRAGRDHMAAGLNQLAARGKNPLPSGRRSRFNDDKRVRSQIPEPLQNRRPNLRGEASFRT